VRGKNKLLSTRSKKRLARRLVVVSIFALAFAAFWLFLRYLTTERTPSQDSSVVRIHLTESVS
jgi:multidrug efflux pump subunit AcrB